MSTPAELPILEQAYIDAQAAEEAATNARIAAAAAYLFCLYIVSTGGASAQGVAEQDVPTRREREECRVRLQMLVAANPGPEVLAAFDDLKRKAA